MAFERFNSQFRCRKVDAFEELGSRERTKAVGMSPGKEMMVIRGVVDGEMIVEGCLRVVDPHL